MRTTSSASGGGGGPSVSSVLPSSSSTSSSSSSAASKSAGLVRNIRDLAEELKMSSHARSLGSTVVSAMRTDVMHELRLIVTATIDKNDLNRQMDASRVNNVCTSLIRSVVVVPHVT